MIKNPIQIAHIKDIIDLYDIFIIDQWGVLHDGVKAFAGADHALKCLKEAGKQVAILSNSGKPAQYSANRMAEIGINRQHYDFMLTSGEHARYCLEQRPEPFYQALGNKYYIFAWNEYEHEVIENLPYQRVAKVEDAEFIICAGLDNIDIESFMPRLKKGIEAKLPMICVNSDLVTVAPNGKLIPCPGTLATHYEAMGGLVRWHGKPDPWLYKTIATKFGTLERAIGIGDSLDHDIKGANQAQISSLLVTNGIHKKQLPSTVTSESVAELAHKIGRSVDFFMPDFQF